MLNAIRATPSLSLDVNETFFLIYRKPRTCILGLEINVNLKSSVMQDVKIGLAISEF